GRASSVLSLEYCLPSFCTFDRKSAQTERSELMEAHKNKPSSITEHRELMEAVETIHSSITSPLKTFPSESSQARFGTTVMPPLRQIGAGFAIAKAFNAALLVGVWVEQVV